MPPAKQPPAISKRDAEKTRARIIEAARTLFCNHGVDGATVEAIARSAKVNKRMIYYYFGGKEDLYLTVLEETYAARRRHDAVLELDADPERGIRRLVRASFRYCRDNPDYIKLLMAENMNQAANLKRSKKIRDLHGPLLEMVGVLLERGHKIGVFRAYADPLHVYLTIASLCFFYHSNNATLSTIFGRDFSSSELTDEREVHVEDVVLAYLHPRSNKEKAAG